MQMVFSSKGQKGQGLVEYALILVLVAIVVIAALMVLGPIIGNVFTMINTSLVAVGGGGTCTMATLMDACSEPGVVAASCVDNDLYLECP